MQRRSYYPHNQHLISTATATSSGLASSRPGTPANDLRVENNGLRIEGDMRMDGGGTLYNGHSIEIAPGEDIISKEREAIRMEKLHTEKDYS